MFWICCRIRKSRSDGARARAEVVAKRDMRAMTERLVECYRAKFAECAGEAVARIVFADNALHTVAPHNHVGTRA